MAFVSRADRTLNYGGMKGSDLGPGAYLGLNQQRAQAAYAPFSSTTERDQGIGQLYTPGPGSYSTSNLTGAMTTGPRGPVIDQFGREKLSGPFASKDDRFRSKKTELAPGPGAYDTGMPWVKTKKQPTKQEWNTMNWLRLPSAPSIPAPTQAFGYDETPAGELIMQKNPEKVFTGTGKDCVGPGHYNAKKADEVWKSKGTAWHKSKTKRLAVSAPATGEKVGPGSYNEFQISLAPMYKFKPNAVFASGSKRTSYIPQVGKEPNQDPEITEEEEERDGAVPGPGTYYDQQKASSFQTKQVPQRLQFFGSTSSRFSQKKPQNPNIGPGTYGEQRKPLIPKKSSDPKVPFNSKDLRFQHRPESNPGPGSYKELHFTDDTKKRAWGRQGVFGTTEKRFVGTANLTTPGPGYYPPDAHKRVGIHNSTNRKPLSVFASKTKRTGDTQNDGPAPGQYEVPSTFEAKHVGSGTGNPLLAGIGENKKREAAFNIKSQRFGRQVAEEKVGPGTYDPKPTKDIKAQNPVFLPQVRGLSRHQDSRRREWQGTRDRGRTMTSKETCGTSGATTFCSQSMSKVYLLIMKSERDTANFRLDEYEQSTEEFEKYVQAINSQPVPVRKGTAQQDLKSAVMDYVSRFKSADGGDLHQLYSILKAVKDWGADPKQKAVNTQVYQIQCKLSLLAQKHKEFKRQLLRLDAQLQTLRAARPTQLDSASGFESEDALDEALNELNIQQGKTDENEDLGKEIDRLKGMRSKVKEFEKFNLELQSLASERHSVEKFLKDTAEDFKALKVREGFLNRG